MEPAVIKVGTTELVSAFVEQELAGLIMNAQGAVLEFRPANTNAKFKDDDQGVKHVLLMAKTYWEDLIACLRKKSQPMSRDPKSSPDDRELKVPGAAYDATVHVMFDCHRPSNEVKAIRLHYAGNHATRNLRPDLSRC